MRIILSPAKKMKRKEDSLPWQDLPVFLEDTKQIADWLRSLSLEEARDLWKCNEKLARENYDRLQSMCLIERLTPAILSYEGIQYQYMAPTVFETNMLSYVQKHLRILSGFYGVLKPMDGVTPYRLEMQAKTDIHNRKGLYNFWGNRLYQEVIDDSHIILNLASKEYSKSIEPYLQPEDIWITCIFGEWTNGKIIQKGVYAKMARGEMVRFLAQNQICCIDDIKSFCGLGYQFCEELSDASTFVFIK
ncbi:MAG: peroxide stress protein YaaA [Lachnospiraceae bacterium]